MIKLFKQYKWWLGLLLLFSLVSNGLGLIIPRQVSKYIDLYQNLAKQGLAFSSMHAVWVIGGVALIVLIGTAIQFVVSTYLSEKVAYDLRNELVASLKKQSYTYVSETTSSSLLTNLTADIDAIKGVASQGIVGVCSALFTLIGVIILLLILNWKLALETFIILPFLMLTFFVVFAKLGSLFKSGQENLEKINKVINESIIAAPLVRVLNAGIAEISKFGSVNMISRDIGLKTLSYFSMLIPVITLLANGATLIILWFGGRSVIAGTLSLGQLSAFFAYSSMFIWPIFVLGFSGSMFSRAAVSYARIKKVIDAPVIDTEGTHTGDVKGQVEFRNVSLELGKDAAKRSILKDVSFIISPKTRNAIVGPTAAGKTQLFYLLAGLIRQTGGDILIDNRPLEEWQHESYLGQLGLVFQDSIVFNTTLRENVDFRLTGDEEAVRKALRVAELGDLLKTLPKGLDTLLNERGTNLSGGQKQRLMLARALAQNPKILLLDDFTARVDMNTEQAIIQNIKNEYPDLTLISITQKIDPIKEYDQVIVLMEGEIIDQGTHEDLIKRSVEYKQIYQSQQKAH